MSNALTTIWMIAIEDISSSEPKMEIDHKLGFFIDYFDAKSVVEAKNAEAEEEYASYLAEYAINAEVKAVALAEFEAQYKLLTDAGHEPLLHRAFDWDTAPLSLEEWREINSPRFYEAFPISLGLKA